MIAHWPRAVKQIGPIWLGMSAETRSIRPYRTFAAIWRMVARTAFTQLHHSALLLIGTAAGMFFTYLAPPIFTLAGYWMAAAAYAAMCVAYVPMLRFYGQSPLMALLLPVAALFYLGATIHSAVQYWIGARRSMERARAGPTSINLDQFRRRGTTARPTFARCTHYARCTSSDAMRADRVSAASRVVKMRGPKPPCRAGAATAAL